MTIQPLPEFDLKIVSVTIQPTNRKLKATWSYEAAEDFNQWQLASWKKDINDLAAAINEEVDKEILEDLLRQEQETPWGFKKKKRPAIRKITDDWEVSNLD